MAKKKKDKIQLTQSSGFGSVLGDALKAQGFNLSKELPSSEPPPSPESIDYPSLKKVILRKEKKGRGGKTVTLIEGISASSDALESLAKELRKGLGCGARVEDHHLVLQGDIRERASQWFAKKGVKKIIES